MRYLVLSALIAAVMATAGVPLNGEEFPARTGIPPVGRSDPGLYRDVVNAHGGEGVVRCLELLARRQFDTGLMSVTSWIVPPGAGIGGLARDDIEELYVALEGPVRFTVDGHASDLPAGTAVLCTPGSSHRFFNPGDRAVRLLGIEAVMGEGNRNAAIAAGSPSAGSGSPKFKSTVLDRTLLRSSPNSHDGKGSILFRRLWSSEDFASNLFAVSHAVLPPGSSIGYHRHNTREEVYYIVSGGGRLTVNGSTFAVQAGDAVPCRLHGSHGIFNDTAGDLELFVFSVAVEKGVVPGERNLGDDQTGR